MPSFRTAPELDSSQPSPYNDLNRVERHADRNSDRNHARSMDRDDRRDDRDVRDERNSYERNGLDRNSERDRVEVSRRESAPERAVDRAVAAVERPVPTGFGVQGQPLQSHPLIEGLFSKLPQPETEWSLQSRQKWLQTAANIFDLMYVPNEAEVGELAIRVERTSQR
jgi:hypothetical protein